MMMTKVKESDTAKKIIVGVCIGLTMFLLTDFIVSRTANAATDARQDTEIQALRRDVARQEIAMAELRKLSLEILKEVRK